MDAFILAVISAIVATILFVYANKDANIGRTYLSRKRNSQEIGKDTANVAIFVFVVVYVIALAISNN